MKIVLVNPPITFKERYGKFSSTGSRMPSYGLLLLAAIARKEGYEVKIIEAAALGMSFQKTEKEILEFGPSILGITASTVSIFHANKLAQIIKKKNPKITTIIGGPHLTAVPKETMRKFKSLDIGVIGEGEETLIDLLRTINNHSNLLRVKGIVFRRGKILIQTKPRPSIKNLDSLPLPAWDLLAGFPNQYRPAPFRYKQLPAVMLLSSRGCPYHCLFCDRSVFGNVCRCHSPEYIFEEIKLLNTKWGIKEIVFEDDTFFVFKKNIEKLCQLLITENLGISWSCAGRVNMVDSELLNLMKKAGCWQVSYGLESGNEKILKFISKNVTLSQIEEAIKITQGSGILSKGFFILGHPKETEQSINDTITFAKKLPLTDASFFKMTPLPGSNLARVASRYGWFLNDWRKMNLLETVFIPHGFTKKLLDFYQKKAFREFYFRPKIFLSYLTRIIENPKICLNLLGSGLNFVKGVI